MTWRVRLSVGADILSIAFIAAVVAAFVFRGGAIRDTSEAAVSDAPEGIVLTLENLPVAGATDATVTIIEFSDFECPFCRKHARGVLRSLRSEFIDSGRVRYAFANNPQRAIHPRAATLAAAGICASEQGQFWPLHDELFRDPLVLDDEPLQRIVPLLALDSSRFLECLSESTRIEPIIDRQVVMARKLGLVGTPGFVLGFSDGPQQMIARKLLRGAQPLEVFRQAINDTILASETLTIFRRAASALLRDVPVEVLQIERGSSHCDS